MTKQSNARTIPASWVDRIFDRMQGYYGSIWVDRWRTGEIDNSGRDCGLINAKVTWCLELGGFCDEPERIQRAIESCRSRNLPPTLPEFLDLCRQAQPNPVASIPAPKVTPEIATQRANAIRESAENLAKNNVTDYRKWARDIMANPKKYPYMSVKLAREALDIPVER